MWRKFENQFIKWRVKVSTVVVDTLQDDISSLPEEDDSLVIHNSFRKTFWEDWSRRWSSALKLRGWEEKQSGREFWCNWRQTKWMSFHTIRAIDWNRSVAFTTVDRTEKYSNVDVSRTQRHIRQYFYRIYHILKSTDFKTKFWTSQWACENDMIFKMIHYHIRYMKTIWESWEMTKIKFHSLILVLQKIFVLIIESKIIEGWETW